MLSFRILTPALGFEGGKVCLEFAYHMFGDDIDYLKVYKNYDDGLTWTMTTLWEKNGTQELSNSWIRVMFDFIADFSGEKVYYSHTTLNIVHKDSHSQLFFFLGSRQGSL